MSHALANHILQPAALNSRVGRDPDGVVDNRPGVSHPNMRRDKTVSKDLKSSKSKDLFCRDIKHGRELVNSSHQARGQKQDGNVAVGIGIRNPGQRRPKSLKKKSGRPGRYASSDELWTGAFECTISLDDERNSEDK